MKQNLTGTAEVIIKTPAHKVWQALTQPEIIKQYFFGTDVHTEWQVGGPIKFSGEYQGKKYEDKGTILAFKPEKLIQYKYWSSMSGLEDKPENYQTISYKVSEEKEGTKVEIIQENIADEKTKEHSQGNWKMVLAKLKMLLEDSNEVAAY